MRKPEWARRTKQKLREPQFQILLTRATLKTGLLPQFFPVPYSVGALVGQAMAELMGQHEDLSAMASTNVAFLSTVMWDGRENAPGRSIHDNLKSQANDATLGHVQATASPTNAQLEQIVAFQTDLFTAQSRDNGAGRLDARGATGGPENLSTQNFFLGINDAFGSSFNPAAFTLYQPWLNLTKGDGERAAARQSIARGEELFNTKPIAIIGVAGINDALNQPTVMGTCTTCHDTPNAGDHSLSVPLNIGITAGSPLAPLDVQGLPVFTLTCQTTRGPVSVDTTDPGRALVSGKCQDIGKTKGPILRGLAARAPYFHNGSGTSLSDVVDFYNARFSMGLSAQEKADLVNALGAF